MDNLMDNFLSDRDNMLKLVEDRYFDEITDLLAGTVLGAVVINPREERAYFTDSMIPILGPEASQDMLLTSFFQHIPVEIRDEIQNRYDTALRALVIEDKPIETIQHTILKNEHVSYDVDVRLKAVADENQTKYVIGMIINRTRSVNEIALDQLFASNSRSYLFVYDTLENVCKVSQCVIDDFELPSDVIDNFSDAIRMYINPDDTDLVVDLFNAFLNSHANPGHPLIFRVLSPVRGEMYFKLAGFSDAGEYDVVNTSSRYISFECIDVTDYEQTVAIKDQLLDGSSAITFYADITNGALYFTENINEIYPGARLEIYSNDLVEELASMVTTEDRKRFQNEMHRVTKELDSKFAIEYRISLPDKRKLWIACRGKSYFDTSRNANVVVGAIFDLTQMNEVRETVEKKNVCNDVTGLQQRDRLLSDTEKLLRNPELLSAAMVLLDLNEFKAFNDRYGHSLGNELLISVASLLNSSKPTGATLYHIGIDTFAMLWPHSSQIKVTEYMESLQERSTQPIEIGDGEYFINFSLAAAFYPLCSNADELLMNSEIALHKVKQNKRAKYAIYTPVDKNELKERLDFELQITQCIRNNMENFQLYYQPLVDAKTGVLKGAEALLRWKSNSGELVNPEKVVAALETTDQMGAVSVWILDQAIKQCASWIQMGAPEDFYVHINATADDLTKGNYAETVKEALGNYSLRPENILIEITETSLVKNIGVCRKNLNALKRANIKSALDDFGSGYSSFNYLKELPVDEIKIDKSFVDDMDTVEFNRSFISAITMLAHSIDKKVVVEGVETESQMKAIREMGADIFQGYYFGKPMSVFAFTNQYFK